MQRKALTRTLPALGAVAIVGALVARGGSLTPPSGPVAPTMKTLVEVEPRIAISAANTPGDADSVFRIDRPGSYYLTGNVVGAAGQRGIEIASSSVTIDLMGFTLRGQPGSLQGVATDGGAFDDLTVRNGVVAGWGGDGVHLSAGGLGSNGHLEDLLASSNGGFGLVVNRLGVIRGCSAYANGLAGISGGAGGLIETSTAYDNDGDGIVVGSGGTAHACTARLNTGSGIAAAATAATITSCSATSNSGNGILTLHSSHVSDCSASGNGSDGINTTDACTVSRCTASKNSGDGIEVTDECRVTDNTCAENGSGAGDGAGIHVTGSGNRVDANSAVSNDRGIDVDSLGNFIVRNTARDNTSNYEIVADNVVGVIFQGTLSPAISGSTGGSGVGSQAGWSNFSF